MKTLTQVPPPSTLKDQRWWPDLFIRQGRTLTQVTPEKASKLMNLLRGDRGASEVRPLPLHNIDGQRIGHVSYNGRVWLNDIDGDKEIPIDGVAGFPGRKTAAQHEADGWRDCR